MRLLPTTAALAALLIAAAARAEPMDAAAFEALAENRTLYFQSLDGPYGAEQFLPGRRSLWRFEGEATCRAGTWYPDGATICFRYDPPEGPSCWLLERSGGRVVARMADGDPDAVLALGRIDDTPLPCPMTGPGS